MRSVARAAVVPVLLYFSWIAMMAVHESGHALHAIASGGSVSRVSIPWFGFSQTFFRSNPHPEFVVWGGPVWGSVFPFVIWAITPSRWKDLRAWVQFWAGFCLITNGAYLGIGWTMKAGDAGDLLRYGTPVWVMVLFGGVAFSAGLGLWHLLGKRAERQNGQDSGFGVQVCSGEPPCKPEP